MEVFIDYNFLGHLTEIDQSRFLWVSIFSIWSLSFCRFGATAKSAVLNSYRNDAPYGDGTGNHGVKVLPSKPAYPRQFWIQLYSL